MAEEWTYNQWNTLANCVYATATSLIAAAAIWGVWAWRSQQRLKHTYDLAREVSRRMFILRQHIRDCRNPHLFREAWLLPPLLPLDAKADRYIPEKHMANLIKIGRSLAGLDRAITQSQVFIDVLPMWKCRNELIETPTILCEMIDNLAYIRQAITLDKKDSDTYPQDFELLLGKLFRPAGFAGGGDYDELDLKLQRSTESFVTVLNHYLGVVNPWVRQLKDIVRGVDDDAI